MRLDLYLVENKLLESRNKANDTIKKGWVSVNNRIINKPSFQVSLEDDIKVIALDPYVSRSGNKLNQALEEFGLNVEGFTCLDIGASTGGFTDCLLQHKVRKVYAYDVGSNQLHPTIKNNPKVTAKENINCRYLTQKDINDNLDLIVMDVSFISSSCFFTAISELLNDNKACIILFKPQFEVKNQGINKNGIVTKRKDVLKYLYEYLENAKISGLNIQKIIPAKVVGKDGNQEYLTYFIKNGPIKSIDIERVVL